MFHNIIVPVDGSEPCRTGIALALRLARDDGATITFVNVLETAKIAAMTSTSPMDPSFAIEAAQSAGKEFLAEATAQARGSGVTTKAVSLDGDPVSSILDLAQQIKADLIVVGSHGRGGIPRALLGSVAEGLLRKSDIPVLINHPAKPERRAKKNV